MRTLWNVALREYKRLLHQPIYWFGLILAPLFCCLFFTTLMWQGLPTDLPMGVIDEDNTPTTRALLRNLDAFQQSEIVATYPTVTEARRAMQEGKIYGFFYIPKGVTRQATRGDQPTISFYSNMSYFMGGAFASRDMRMMSELASAAATQKTLRAKGATEQQTLAFIQPIVIDTHPIGNPWLNYNIYLSNVILYGILGIFVFMLTVYSLGSEIKQATARQWLSEAKWNMLTALSGKLLPQTMAFFFTASCFNVILYGFLHFPCHSGFMQMTIVALLFIIACQGLAVGMFTLLTSLRLGLSFASLWGVLSVSICGMAFPCMAMDAPLQGLAYLFPLRYYYLLYVNGALDGYDLSNALPFIGGLIIFACIPLIAAPFLKKEVLTIKYQP